MGSDNRVKHWMKCTWEARKQRGKARQWAKLWKQKARDFRGALRECELDRSQQDKILFSIFKEVLPQLDEARYWAGTRSVTVPTVKSPHMLDTSAYLPRYAGWASASFK